jgi:hypothetical protein
VIGNKGERAKGIVCTDVNLVPATACLETYPLSGMPTGAVFTVPGDQFCIQWPDRDNNICVGKKKLKLIIAIFNLHFKSRR